MFTPRSVKLAMDRARRKRGDDQRGQAFHGFVQTAHVDAHHAAPQMTVDFSVFRAVQDGFAGRSELGFRGRPRQLARDAVQGRAAQTDGFRDRVIARTSQYDQYEAQASRGGGTLRDGARQDADDVGDFGHAFADRVDGEPLGGALRGGAELGAQRALAGGDTA